MSDDFLRDYQPVNLDAINEEKELLVYAEMYRKLSEYAKLKAYAVRRRKEARAGSSDIDVALRHEKSADQVYKTLPVRAKW